VNIFVNSARQATGAGEDVPKSVRVAASRRTEFARGATGAPPRADEGAAGGFSLAPLRVGERVLRCGEPALRRAPSRAAFSTIDNFCVARRVRSQCHFVLSFRHFIPHLLRGSVALFLKRQCDRTLDGGSELPRAGPVGVCMRWWCFGRPPCVR
jgi:hypothetical protein